MYWAVFPRCFDLTGQHTPIGGFIFHVHVFGPWVLLLVRFDFNRPCQRQANELLVGVQLAIVFKWVDGVVGYQFMCITVMDDKIIVLMKRGGYHGAIVLVHFIRAVVVY